MKARTRKTKRPQRPGEAETVREMCCQVLTQAETGRRYVDQVLEEHLAATSLAHVDRALVTTIVHGTTRWRARLDFELASHFRQGYDRARPLLKNILRTALFQMRFLDRVPAYAAINEAVTLIRRHFGEPMARLGNAVLRNTQRHPYEWAEPGALLQNGDWEQLAACLSHPAWLLQRWHELFGAAEMLALAQAGNKTPEVFIRLVRASETRDRVLLELQDHAIAADAVSGIADFFCVHHPQQLTGLPGFRRGDFTIQDPSAGLVACLASPHPGDTVIDLCAAPGGKALALAETIDCRVIAVDRSVVRLSLLQQAAQRLRLKIAALVADARSVQLPPADLVLVDAPCSGLGVLARRSDLRWRRKPHDLDELASLQQRIMVNAATLVKSTGKLLYSTCTIEPRENEEIVRWFLQEHPEFELVSAREFVDRRFCDAEGFVRTLPHHHAMDGSFAALMIRRTGG